MGKPSYNFVEIIETKECSECYQLIDTRASRCPHCCSHLDKSPKSKLKRMELTVVALSVISAIGWIAFSYTFGLLDSAEALNPPQKTNVTASTQSLESLSPEASDRQESGADRVMEVAEKLVIAVSEDKLEYDAVLVSNIVGCKGNLITNVGCGL